MTERNKFPPDDKNKLLDRRPEVIVDFIFDQGLFFIAVENIGDSPAIKVSARFEPNFSGVGGQVEVSSLPLFANIEFLAPHKPIRTFLDTSSGYFERGEATRISVHINYQDREDRQFQDTIYHDLSIYQDIGYVLDRDSSAEI